MIIKKYRYSSLTVLESLSYINFISSFAIFFSLHLACLTMLQNLQKMKSDIDAYWEIMSIIQILSLIILNSF